MATDNPKGLRRNLTNYGDRGFALYLRRSFARSMGYSQEMLERPIVGIAQIASGFNNCHRTMPELGGSTNAVTHLTAVAGRSGIAIDLKRLNQFSDETLVLVNLKPTGQHYLQDLHAAGGLSALLWELRDLLHLDSRTVEGGTLGERLAAPPAYVDHAVVRRPREEWA